MARILYAWELGDGLGHTHLLAQLARHPRLGVHQSLFALPRLAPSATYLDAHGLAYVAAPAPMIDSAARDFRADNYADILVHNGYADATTLRARIEAWRRLLDASGADLIIADSAPTLMLAARDRVPVVAAGTPFGLPPIHLGTFPALPSLHDGRASTPALPQSRLHGIVSTALADDAAPATTLPGWFRAVARIPLVFPLLDPYRDVRRERAVGPAQCADGPLPPPPAPRVFAYLADEYPAVHTVLDALDTLNVPVDVYLRGGASATSTLLQGRRVNALAMPFDIDMLMGRTSLVVHHGALGITQYAMARGRPQLVLPFHLENTLTAKRLLRAGIARGAGYAELATLPAMLARALTDIGLTARARRMAAELHRVDWCGVDQVADAVDRALAGGALAT